MNATPKCLRCGTQMEEGFIPGERNKVVLVTIWVAGRPEPSFWKGTKITGKEQRAVTRIAAPVAVGLIYMRQSAKLSALCVTLLAVACSYAGAALAARTARH